MTNTDTTTRIIPQKELMDALYKHIERHPDVMTEGDDILALTRRTHENLMQSHPEAIREGVAQDVFDKALLKSCVALRLYRMLVRL